MDMTIDRFYLDIFSKNNLIKSKCTETDLEIFLEKYPTPDFCKFLYKEVGKDFFWRDRLRWSEQEWLDYINKKFFKLYVLKYNNKLAGFYELLYDSNINSIEIP